MAKLNNMVPISGKRRIVLRGLKLGAPTDPNHTMKVDLDTVLKQIDAEQNLQDPLDKKKFFFRIRKVGFNFKSTMTQATVPCMVFGREYAGIQRSNNIGYDSTVSPEPTEGGGLGHDAAVLHALGDTGATTKLDSIHVASVPATMGSFDIIVDFVPKIVK